MIESKVTFPDVTLEAGVHTLTIRPLSPAIVLHKIIVDCGGDMSGRLNLTESPRTRTLKKLCKRCHLLHQKLASLVA